MTDLEAITMAQATVQERKFAKFVSNYRDFTLRPKEIRRITAADEQYFLRFIDAEVVVRAENGVYDKTNMDVSESVHVFTGQIELVNTSQQPKNVQFLQVLYVSKGVTPGVTPP
jgi:hypothetical protein